MNILRKEIEFPIMLGFEKEGLLAVWCPFCADFHYHTDGEGHRVAHCKNPNSPFHISGYIVKKAGGRELKNEKNHKFQPNDYPALIKSEVLNDGQ